MIKKFNLKLIVFLMAWMYSMVLSAQINSSTAVVPFGANPSYGNGIMPTNLPSGGAYGKSQDAADAYTEWRNNYTEACGGGMYRVKFDEPNRTVSEGIGYGMQLAAYAADKALFDGLYTYWKNFKSPASNSKTGKLMNWRIEGCGPTVSGTGSAADADVDAAWALLIAENQWPTATNPFDYASEATNMLYAIKELELNSAGQLINGDGWGFADNCRNPGYQSPAYYPFFATNNTAYAGNWNGAVTSAYTLLNANADGTTGLISDWSNPSGVRNTCNPGGLGYAATDGYGYDACRNPWRMAQDVIWNNSASGKAFCTKIAAYLNTRGAGNVGGPLYQNGSNYSGYAHNATFVATFATAVMGSTNQALMNSMYTETKNTKDVIKNSTLSGYFGNTLRCVALFMMSGNYWKPGTSSLQEINVRQNTTNYLNASTYDFQNQQTTPPAVSGKTATFTIENLGFATLNLTGTTKVVLGGTNANQFSIVQPSAASLALGATTTFTVTFTPTTTGEKSATLTIASNDPDENPYVINLIGTGTANITSPKISVFDAETKTAVANNGTIAMGTSSAGSVDVRRIGIVNTGDAALNLTYLVAGTGYTIVTVPAAPPIVAINDTGYVYVQATSVAAGTPAGSLTMTSNDNVNPSFKVNFTSNFVACGTATTTNEVYQDFEGNYKNTTLAYTFTGFTELVDNTHIDERNPSTKVAQLDRAGAGYQGPRYTFCGTGTVNLTAAKFVVSMLVYSPAAGVPIQMNLKTAADVANTTTYPSRSSVTAVTTKANQWERIYFNHTGAIGVASITNIEIYIEPTATTPTPVLPTTATYLIDDIRLDAAPCLTDNSGVIQDFNDHNNSTLAYGVSGYNPGATTGAPNNVAGGLNTSSSAGRFLKNAATADYGDGLRYVGCGGKLDFSTKKYVSMLVYSSVANAKINLSPKIGATDVLVQTPTTQTVFANKWHRVYFDLSAIPAASIPNITGLDIFFDPLNDLGAQTYWFDDLRYESAPPCVAGIDATDILNDFDDNRYLNIAFPGAVPVAPSVTYFNTVNANPSTVGNTSAVVGKFLRGLDTDGTSFRFTACQSKLDLSAGHNIIEMKIYSPQANVPVVMSLKNAGGTSLIDITDTVKVANAWTTLRFDATKLLNSTVVTSVDIIVDPNALFSGSSSSTAARTYYVDDLRYALPSPEINVQALTAPNATDIASKGSFNMGTATVGDSTLMNFNIQNNGLQTLTLTGTGIASVVVGGANAGDFIVSASPSFSTSIGAFGAAGFTVKFKPTAAGARSASLTIVSNDANEGTYVVYLNGTATVPIIKVLDGGTALSPVIANNNTTAINIGTSAVGVASTPAYTMSIKNTGVAPLKVTSITPSAGFTVTALTPTGDILTGAIATFTITGTPAATGINTGTLTVLSNDPATPSYKVNITVTGSVPVISVADAAATTVPNNNTTAISVGSGPVGAAVTPAYTFTIKNTGTGPLTITSVTPTTGFTVTAVTPTGAIAAAGSATFTVTGTPAAAGLNTGSLTIVSNDPVTPSYKVNITVTGTVPALQVLNAAAIVTNNNTTPISVGTATVATAATAYTSFSIKNTGLAPLSLTSITGSAGFAVTAITPTAPGTVAPNGTVTFTVTGTPAAVGVNTGTITIVTNDPTTPSFKINVTVTGTPAATPALQVLNTTTILANNATPAISVGSSVVATAATPYTSFSIKNAGTAALTFTSITGSAGFAVTAVTPAAPTTIAAGGTATFTVTGTPAALGTNTGTITIVTNDPTTPSFVINVTVTGTAAPVPALQVLNSAAVLANNATPAISVGTAPITTAATPYTSFSIKNNGTAALSLTSITGSAGFAVTAITPTAPASIAAGGTATFTVTGTPAVAGANTGTITIVTNDPTTPSFVINVSVTGTVAPKLEVLNAATVLANNATPATSVGSSAVGTAATAYTSFSIKNAGTSALTFTSITGSAGFAVTAVTPAAPTSIAVNGTATFTVTGTPAALGANTGTITIVTNDPTTPSFVINVSVTGIAASTPAIQVLNTTAILTNNATPAISVGSAPTGTAATAYTSFSVKNVGTAALALTSITGSTGFAVSAITPATPGSIAIGATATFTVTATPAANGVNTGTITIVTDDPTTPSFVINVSVTGTVPALQVLNAAATVSNNNSPAISVGTATVATAATAYTSFSVKNTGTGALTLTSITGSAGFAVTAVTPATPATIAPNGTATFTVTATPASVGANAGTITIVTNDPTTPSFVVNVTATGTPTPTPSLQVLNSGTPVTANNTPAISVGSAVVASAATGYTSLSIKNNGTAALTLTSITGSAGFAVTGVTPATPATIAANGTATFTVTGTPAALGLNTGTITIVTNDPTTPSFVVNVTVTGTAAPAPALTVLNGAATVANNNSPAISVGSAVVNTAGNAYTSISVKNTGNAPLTLTSITGSAGFAVTGITPATPATIAANGTATFTVKGTPAVVGANAGTITIVTNDPTTPSFVVNVTVTGTAAPQATVTIPGATNNGPAVSIGSAVVGNPTAPYTFTIANTGSLPLTIGTITSSNPDFVVTQVSPSTIAPGGNGTFTVTATPSAIGTSTGAITIPSNDPGSPFVINVSAIGTGTPTGPALQLKNYAGQVLANGSSSIIGSGPINAPIQPQIFTVTNIGGSDLVITNIIAVTGFSTTQPSPLTIPAGASRTFTITGTPNSTTATRWGAITIMSNDPAGSFTLNAGVNVGPTTGVRALSSTDITMFPNPTTLGYSNIEFNGAYDDVVVTVYSADGSRAIIKNFSSVVEATRQLDVQELPAGVYFVEVATAQGKIVQRLIKQ